MSRDMYILHIINQILPIMVNSAKGRVHFQRPICDIFLTLKCCSFIKKLIGIQKM